MKISLLIILSLLTLQATSYAEDPLVAGKAALEKGDIQGAISLLKEAVRKEKKNPQAYLWLGTAFLKADSVDQCIAALVQARELDSANAQIYNLLGDAYAKQNITAGAIQEYKRASEIDSTSKVLFFKLAEANRKARQYNEAARAYMRVIMLDSNNVPALCELGKIYYRAKQWPKALGVFDRLYTLIPDSLGILIQYARVLSETKNYDKLIPVALKVLQRDGSQSEVETMLAEAYNATGNNEKAVEAYSNKNPDSLAVDDLIRFAKALKALDNFEKSLEMYERVTRKDTARCDIIYDMGTLYMKVKKYPEAVTMFEKKIVCDTLSGYRFASHLNAGMSLMYLKKFDEAKDHIKKSLEIRPDNIQAWQTLAQDNAQLGATTEALEAYKKLIELANEANTNGEAGKYNAQLEEAYRMVGVQLLIDKKYAASADYLKKALQFKPRDCSLLLWTAQAYHNSNNKQEAKKYYCKVMEACPKTKEAKDAENGLKILGEDCGQ